MLLDVCLMFASLCKRGISGPGLLS